MVAEWALTADGMPVVRRIIPRHRAFEPVKLVVDPPRWRATSGRWADPRRTVVLILSSAGHTDLMTVGAAIPDRVSSAIRSVAEGD